MTETDVTTAALSYVEKRFQYQMNEASYDELAGAEYALITAVIAHVEASGLDPEELDAKPNSPNTRQ